MIWPFCREGFLAITGNGMRGPGPRGNGDVASALPKCGTGRHCCFCGPGTWSRRPLVCFFLWASAVGPACSALGGTSLSPWPPCLAMRRLKAPPQVKTRRVWSEAASVLCLGLASRLCFAMAAAAAKGKKPKVMKVIAPKVVQDNVRVKIEDVSFGKASGWRDVDPKRTAELKKDFSNGLFGVNILKRPMILGKHEKIATAPDGNASILDGKHTFTALAELSVLYKAAMAAADDGPATAGNEDVADDTTWSPLLIAAITEGVPCDVVQFEDVDDADAPIAYCVAAHDDAANKYKPSSVRDAVGVANRYKARVAGGTWAAVQTLLQQIYGSGRRKMCYNMVLAAETLPEEILKRMDEVGLPNSYVYDNKYFSGQNQDKAKRLSDKGRLACIAIYEEVVLTGGQFSVKSFTDDVCQPLRHAEHWIASKKNLYGILAASPTFLRVADYLLSGRARLLILGCMRSGLRLEGTSAENMGVEQCFIVIKDLEAQKKAAASAGVQGHLGFATAGDAEKAAAADETADALVTPTVGLTGQCEVEDTARMSANSKAEAVLNKFNYFDGMDKVSQHLTPILHQGNKVMVWIDCLTSKSRVGLGHLTEFSTFLGQNGHSGEATASGHPLKVRLVVSTGT